MNKTRYLTVILQYLEVVIFLVVLLYFGKTLFIPLFLGLLTAIVLYPVCKWLEDKKYPKWLAIMLCLSIVAFLFGIILFLLSWQLRTFSKDAHHLFSAIENTALQWQSWMTEHLHVVNNDINWSSNLASGMGAVIKSTLQITVSTLFMLFLVPVYAALFLYHRRLFVQFLKTIIPSRYQQKLDVVLQKTIHTYFNYIKGMLLVYLVVGILNSIGLYALGVRHALLFGMLCAIMTIIPYIGIFLSALMPISVAWLDTGNIWYPVGVIAIFGFVQYLEANVIFPRVVGSQLNVSTFAMLVAIISGGVIWGTAGMVLFIPFVGILKIVSDTIEEWKPINLLLSR